MLRFLSLATLMVQGCSGIDTCDSPVVNLDTLGCMRNPDGGVSQQIGMQLVFGDEQDPKPSADFGCTWDVNADAGTLRLVPTGQVCRGVDEGFDIDRAFVWRVCERPPPGVWLTGGGKRALQITSDDAGLRCVRL